MNNPLFDSDFLKELFENNRRTLYARVTALTFDEKPIEYIEGQITGNGSINIDGKSAVRRTCSLTLVAKDLNITDFYWGLKTKFKLEIGLENHINSNYPDIIWFKQGIFVINSFNTSKSISGYTVNISGKDKMCLLNGDLSGSLAHTTDFGIEEYYDAETGITTYTSIPIKNIIREAVQNFGNELPHNIIINDIEDAGVELLEYRGDIPLYLLKSIETDTIINMTINSQQPCFIDGERTTIDNLPCYDNLIILDENINNPTVVTITDSLDAKQYTVVKVEYGAVPGYRLTDLTYAGDLILNVGETITSLLDKIVNMLGSFEYFYNLDGKFVFQAKKNYVSIPWLNSEAGDELPTKESTPMWSFLNNQLVTDYKNTPNLVNLRNDFAVWGTRKTIAGSELDIHMRYAIDNKPEQYTTLRDGKTYISSDKTYIDDNNIYCDWRELIYQMALDYRKYYHDDSFLFDVANKNPQYPAGRTGYEQYYTDMEGFWRTLYDPKPNPYYTKTDERNSESDNIWLQFPIREFEVKDLKSDIDYSLLFYKKDNTLQPFLGSYVYIEEGRQYGYLDQESKISVTDNISLLQGQNITNIYISLEDLYVLRKMEDGTFKDGLAQLLSKAETDQEIDSKEYIDIRPDVKDYKNFDVQIISFRNTGAGYNKYTKLVDYLYEKIKEEWEQGKINLYITETNSESYYNFNTMDGWLKKQYKDNNILRDCIEVQQYDIYGKEKKGVFESYPVYYYNQLYDYNLTTYWHNDVMNNPETLLFWFDFLDADQSELNKYSVPVVGTRSKALTDKDVKSIYYKDIPKVIFQSGKELYEHQTGYAYIQLQDTMENLFTISSRGKSAKQKVEELLQDCAYCSESISLTALPVYHLEPNHRIVVRDDDSQINGEYFVDKISLPLSYNGTMNITATKVITELL